MHASYQPYDRRVAVNAPMTMPAAMPTQAHAARSDVHHILRLRLSLLLLYAVLVVVLVVLVNAVPAAAASATRRVPSGRTSSS